MVVQHERRAARQLAADNLEVILTLTLTLTPTITLTLTLIHPFGSTKTL